MAKALSLKLKDTIFADVEAITHAQHIPRNTYINEALAYYNRIAYRKQIRATLLKESEAVYQTSNEILREFEKIEDREI